MKFSHRYINIFGLREILQRRIPVMTFESATPGPVIWLTGCIHGDEVGGVVIIHELFKIIRKSGLLNGAVHAFPLVNSLGFENVSRFVDNDREDLNRCFPGNPKGSMGERIADKLFTAIVRTMPDLVIDIHNDWIRSIPYMIIDPENVFSDSDIRGKTIDHVLSSQMLATEESVSEEIQSSRSLAGALVQAGIPAFTMEAGGAYLVIEEHITTCVQAILNIMKDMNMVSEEVPNGPQTGPSLNLSTKLLKYHNRPLCSSSGILRFLVKPSQKIKPQQPVARVYNAFGVVEEVLKSECHGIVLGHHDHALAMPGKEVIAIAREEQGTRDKEQGFRSERSTKGKE